jgi:uncharacterized protein YPO0396
MSNADITSLIIREMRDDIRALNNKVENVRQEMVTMRVELTGRIDATNDRMDAMNENLCARIDGTNERMDAMNDRVDGMGVRIDGTNQRLDRIEIEMRAGFVAVTQVLGNHETRITKLETAK